MANPEHLNILKQGVKAWNTWREKNRSVFPDLTGADLTILRAKMPGKVAEQVLSGKCRLN